MYLGAMFEAIRQDLGDEYAKRINDNEPVRRAIVKAAADLDRVSPSMSAQDYPLGDFDVTNEIFSSGTLGTWVTLANRPIEEGSVVVENTTETTTFTEDTDYTMDYWAGKITCLAAGTMVATTNYYITYIKDRTIVNISTIMPNIIDIVSVEYPVGQMPQEMMQFQVLGDYLQIIARAKLSQFKMTDNEHLRVYYTTGHTIPDEDSVATWRRFLDDTIIRGAAGYTLQALAQKYMLLSVDSLEAASTALGAIDTHATAAQGRLDAVAGYLTAATAGLAGYDDYLVNAAAALTAAGALNTTVASTLSAVVGQVALANTNANSMSTSLQNAANNMDVTGYPDPSLYLTDGDARLNQVNVGGQGSEVPLAYAKYAEVTLAIVKAWSESQVSGHQATASTYLAMAATRISEAQRYIDQIAQRNQEADRWVGISQTVLSNVQLILSQAQLAQNDAATLVKLIEQRVSQSQTYVANASSYVGLADRLKAEANSRLEEFAVLIQKAQVDITNTRTARFQPA